MKNDCKYQLLLTRCLPFSLFCNNNDKEEGDVWEITTGAAEVSIEQMALHMEANTITVRLCCFSANSLDTYSFLTILG